ncbi:MAG: ParB/RepB/Spo0J family partition protein [Desulfovibrio sp.]|nr:ParB/RepB/Spo0J family partition protein [Desulfovibrio sp.]
MNSKGLGRGLDALFGEKMPSHDADNQTSLQRLENLTPNPHQPRRNFDQDALKELANSIRSQGIIQPLLVRPARDGEGYQIVAGERRWRAAKIAGLKEVPVLVRDMDDTEVMVAALVENLQREDLNPIEEAEALKVLRETLQITQEELAERLGKSRSAIANALRLLQLSQEARKDLQEGRLSAGHARCLLSIDEPDAMEKLRLRILSHRLTVREAEEIVAWWKSRSSMPWEQGQASTTKRLTRKKSQTIKQWQKNLRNLMGCRATISGDEEKGRITFAYENSEELKNLMTKWGASLEISHSAEA